MALENQEVRQITLAELEKLADIISDNYAGDVKDYFGRTCGAALENLWEDREELHMTGWDIAEKIACEEGLADPQMIKKALHCPLEDTMLLVNEKGLKSVVLWRLQFFN